MEGDLFVQSATEAHYEWLEQGREAPLSLVKTLALDVFSLLDLQHNPSLLLDSLHKYGIVLVFEHGVGDFFEQSRQFFALSTSAKMELAKPPIQPSKELVYTPVSSNSSSVPPPMKNASFFAPPPPPVIYSKAAVGFVPTHFERLNPFSRPDVKECFDFVCDVHGKGSHLGKSPFPKIKNFEKDATRYFNENLTLARTMLDLIVTASKLPKDVMNQHFEKPLAIQRLLSYPPQNSDTPNELGAGAHVDFGAISLIQQNSDGLKVFVEGEWKSITVPFGAMVVQTGFLLEKLTGGAIPATQHRVINRNPSVRLSTAFFYDPDPSAHICPLLPIEKASKKEYKECIAGHKGVRYAVSGYSTKPSNQE